MTYNGKHRAPAPVQCGAAAYTQELLSDKVVSRDNKVRALALYLNIPTEDADLLMQEVGE